VTVGQKIPGPTPIIELWRSRPRRARFGPGLWPGPRRQARWVGRGLQCSRAGPEDRFCEAVGNDLRVPLTLEGPTRTMRGVPTRSLGPFCQAIGTPGARRRTGQFSRARSSGCVAAGTGRQQVRPADLVAAPRPEGSRPSGRGRPPARSRRAARDSRPAWPGPYAASRSTSMSLRFRVRSRPGPDGPARRRRAFKKLFVEKVVTGLGRTESN
jgi:hypothetical protein